MCRCTNERIIGFTDCWITDEQIALMPNDYSLVAYESEGEGEVSEYNER